MKYFIFSLFLFINIQSIAQNNNTLLRYEQADSLFKNDQFSKAYQEFKELRDLVDPSDTLYDYILWYYIMSTSKLEQSKRMTEDWPDALKYGKESLELIREHASRFREDFADREYWMIKNLVVSNFGLNQLSEAKKYQKLLYKAYKKGNLPEGIDHYYNYDFFTLDGKNIWGYEWYRELPKDRFSSSFTKIVYYVYSTNKDGSDKEQLYRFHVLMFHGDNKNFDYVLDKKIDTEKEEISGTMYNYTYKEDVDYAKLKNDIKEIVKNNIEPDTKRIYKK